MLDQRKIVVAITGASGAAYARRLLRCLAEAGVEIHLIVSPHGRQLLAEELGIRELAGPDETGTGPRRPRHDSQITEQSRASVPVWLSALSDDALVAGDLRGRCIVHAHDDLAAPPASGSFLTNGMVICPCSGNTLAQVASGTASNLIARAAAVHLKEGRRLILVPREMPISQIDIENLLRVSRAGGIICPAAPAFYMSPKSIDDLVDFVAGKVCDLLGVEHHLDTRWDPVKRSMDAAKGEA